jgi:hypothetical protein
LTFSEAIYIIIIVRAKTNKKLSAQPARQEIKNKIGGF